MSKADETILDQILDITAKALEFKAALKLTVSERDRLLVEVKEKDATILQLKVDLAVSERLLKMK